ncbi:hypothetical protein GCM10010353_03820 [Streptomyces chryseus]|nr:hypothetical protein GCM10010353_03820 [Streptomyces chryseus]
MGIALLGSVMNAAYAPAVARIPGVSPAQSAGAANSLGEAYTVADRIGGPAGDALRFTARHAFVHGLHVTLFVSAGLLLLGALAALRLPRLMDCGARGAEKEYGGEPLPQVRLPASREHAGSGRAAR